MTSMPFIFTSRSCLSYSFACCPQHDYPQLRPHLVVSSGLGLSPFYPFYLLFFFFLDDAFLSDNSFSHSFLFPQAFFLFSCDNFAPQNPLFYLLISAAYFARETSFLLHLSDLLYMHLKFLFSRAFLILIKKFPYIYSLTTNSIPPRFCYSPLDPFRSCLF